MSQYEQCRILLAVVQLFLMIFAIVFRSKVKKDGSKKRLVYGFVGVQFVVVLLIVILYSLE